MKQFKKKDKQLIGHCKSQFLHLFLSTCIYVALGFPSCFLSYRLSLLYHAREQWEGGSMQDEGELNLVTALEIAFP